MSGPMKFFYLVGVTNSGKDYFAQRALEKAPSLIGMTNVGQIFRQRYPASHFKGQGAPQNTEEEAFQIFCSEVKRVREEGKRICLVNGQPRRVSQVDRVMYANSEVIWFHEDDDVLVERAKQRDSCQEALDLSMERMVNDRKQLYDVIWHLMRRGVPIHTAKSDSIDGILSAIICFQTLQDKGPDLYV